LVLDPGCGSGRFCDVVSRTGGRAVGVDLSYSIDAAFEEIGLRENVCFVQCDLLNLPFKSGTFDVAFSIGVVHHSRDPLAATKEISRLVRSGGIMAVWVYASWKELNLNDKVSRIHTMVSYAISDFHRIFTSRMSAARLYRLISRLEFICSLKSNPVWSFLLDLIFRSSNNRDPEMWVLDTFDWYSPRYHSKHTYDEVIGWFADLGFTDIKKLDFPVAVQGTARKN
jgi:SAM-dependent methyltransferase